MAAEITKVDEGGILLNKIDSFFKSRRSHIYLSIRLTRRYFFLKYEVIFLPRKPPPKTTID